MRGAFKKFLNFKNDAQNVTERLCFIRRACVPLFFEKSRFSWTAYISNICARKSVNDENDVNGKIYKIRYILT